MKARLSELSNEDKRQICLDLSQVISEAGKEGLAKSEVFSKFKGNEDYSQVLYVKILLTEFVDCLGKNNVVIGSKRGTRYVVDNLETAVSIINDYYDSRMSEFDRWNLYKEICEFIDENKVALDRDVAHHFVIELERIDEMNSRLVEFGVGLDYFNENSQGTKVRLSEGTLCVIEKMIEELKVKENEKLRELKRKNLEKARNSKKDKVEFEIKNKNLIPLESEDRRKIQLVLVEIIYSKGLKLGSIPFEYKQRVGTSIQHNSVEHMLKEIPGVKLHKDGYCQVTDINAALRYLDPFRSKVRIEVGMKKDVKVEYTNMRFSRELGEYNIYILEDDNKYDLYSQILDLMLMGASIDKEVTDKVYKSVMSNMAGGKKSIL